METIAVQEWRILIHMSIYHPKIVFPMIALVVWITVMILFGVVSHFSLGGFCLCIQGLCLYLYESKQKKKPSLAILGIAFAIVHAINAWYLESSSVPFKLFVIVFSLACVYVFVNMIRETNYAK